MSNLWKRQQLTKAPSQVAQFMPFTHDVLELGDLVNLSDY